MQESLRELIAGSVDYAGLFPPASLGMQAAVEGYASYLRDPASAMLGRFVVPVALLREFDEAARPLLSRGPDSQPWRLTALTGPDVIADIDLALKFNCRHWSESPDGHAVIDALEIRASTAPEVESAMSMMPRQITAYFEVPLASEPALFATIARSGGRAKGRAGGVTPDAIPSAAQLAQFIVHARDAGAPFKLTAGLHHPMRGEYRLTYADDAPSGTMFGYLNAFVASVVAWNGADAASVAAALLETDQAALQFRDDSLTYRGTTVPLGSIRAARDNMIVSFGSCSFREPADELVSLHLD